MSIKKYKPTTPSLRFTALSAFDEITKKKPEKSLLASKKRSSGRNNNGRITSRRRGGGHKRKIRILDFKRDKWGVEAKVASIEYDPNRGARIALLHYVDGEKRYILAPDGVGVGDKLISGTGAEVKPGNAMPLGEITSGQYVHNIELIYKKGGVVARGAGTAAVLMGCEKGKAQLKLPSGEIRLVDARNMATVGIVGNAEHNTKSLGKAGRNRWLGKRPSVRGVAMNPVDHPLGGGEGRSSGGRSGCSPTAVPSKGFKTRSVSKKNKNILKRRND